MGRLSDDQYKKIAKGVSVISVSSPEISELSRFVFDCGEATEYRDFLYEDAKPSDKTVSMRRDIF